MDQMPLDLKVYFFTLKDETKPKVSKIIQNITILLFFIRDTTYLSFLILSVELI